MRDKITPRQAVCLEVAKDEGLQQGKIREENI